jgi:hypothetical protein
VLEPGGWRLSKTDINKEMNIDLNNPFMTGRCVCIGSEYRIEWIPTGSDRPQRKGAKSLQAAGDNRP